MFIQRVFNHSAALMAGLVSRLIFSCWARGYEEHYGACEDAYAAHIGPLYLEVNQCFVLDHHDAHVGVRFPRCTTVTAVGSGVGCTWGIGSLR
ncbi:MAG: hypothetical protein IPM39_28440 [Chloroflexi bacterium]|nr:hypothetical protein [Chloroflexota bacterium]